MAKPQNILDALKIYTYHIAIFMAADEQQLAGQLSNFSWTTKTSRTEPNNFCILNSVVDPFQMVDELQINQIAPNVSQDSKLSPIGEISLRIIEPDDCMFITKLIKIMSKVNINVFAEAVFAIKIKFVGRDADSNIIDENSNLPELPPIFCLMSNIESSFNQMGSTYNLKFITKNTYGVNDGRGFENSKFIGSIGTGVSIEEVTTFNDALSKFQEKLQYEYDRYIINDETVKIGRKLKYEFICDNEIGNLPISTKITTKDTTENSKARISFGPNMQICDCIHTIAERCPELLKMIANSGDGVKRPFHVGVKLYQIVSSVIYNTNNVVVKYEVVLYKGAKDKDGSEIPEENKYEFDFYFAENYNVDVINFDIIGQGGYYMLLGASPTDYMSSTLVAERKDKETPTSELTTPKTIDGDKSSKSNDSTTPTTKTNSIIIRPPFTEAMKTGFSNNSLQYAKERAQALDVISRYLSVDNVQKNLRIRGHFGLLKTCLTTMIGVKSGTWVKINIFSRDPETGHRAPYFYQGWYQVIGVTHMFKDGKFEQELNLLMLDVLGQYSS
jgi:hypothetical protein